MKIKQERDHWQHFDDMGRAIAQGSGLLIRWNAMGKGAVPPKRAHGNDACFDLFAPKGISPRSILPGERALILTGIAFSIPTGWEGVIRGRSGMFVKKGLIVPDGTIDADYRGNVGVMIYNSDEFAHAIMSGDAIGQIGFRQVPEVTLKEVPLHADLGKTERGEGGFGSTGAKGAASKP